MECFLAFKGHLNIRADMDVPVPVQEDLVVVEEAGPIVEE